MTTIVTSASNSCKPSRYGNTMVQHYILYRTIKYDIDYVVELILCTETALGCAQRCDSVQLPTNCFFTNNAYI